MALKIAVFGGSLALISSMLARSGPPGAPIEAPFGRSMPAVVGDAAPALDAIDIWVNGVVDPATFDGRVVVVEFVTTWDAVSVAVLARFDALAQSLADESDVVFVAITDGTAADVEAMLATTPVSIPIGCDPARSVHSALGIVGTPRAIVIDPAGRIVADTLPSELSRHVLLEARDGHAVHLTPFGETFVSGDDTKGEPRSE